MSLYQPSRKMQDKLCHSLTKYSNIYEIMVPSLLVALCHIIDDMNMLSFKTLTYFASLV
jgi:hypothetical protein